MGSLRMPLTLFLCGNECAYCVQYKSDMRFCGFRLEVHKTDCICGVEEEGGGYKYKHVFQLQQQVG